MELRHRVQGETEAGHAGGAGVRPGRSDDRPQHDHHERKCEHAPARPQVAPPHQAPGGKRPALAPRSPARGSGRASVRLAGAALRLTAR